MKPSTLHILPLAAALLAAIAATSCDDNNTSAVGPSILDTTVDIAIDSSFTLTGKTIQVQSISPRTTRQLLGALDIDGYGRLSSEVVTQFLPSTVLDTANFSSKDLDSLYLTLSFVSNAFIGDSVAPMGIAVHALTRPLPSDISSDFDPKGYYDPAPLATRVYNTSTMSVNAHISGETYRTMGVKMPTELGKKIFRAFEDNPADFANGNVFCEKVFPGVYIRNTFGTGRMTLVTITGMSFYFTRYTPADGDTKADTTVMEQQYMLVTPEVISNNDLKYDMSPELRRHLDAGENMLIAPTGAEMELTFPLPRIAAAYRSYGGKQAVLNGLSMSIPVDTLANGSSVSAPPYVLLVLKKDREAFFANNRLTDNITSFYARYSDGKYSFPSMREYLLNMLEKDNITPDDYTFALVPVQIDFEQTASSGYYYSTSSDVQSDIQPYLVSPAVAFVRTDKAKIKLSMSRMAMSN